MANIFSTATLGLNVNAAAFKKAMGATGDMTERTLSNMKLSADAFSAKWNDMTAGIKDTKRIISGILISQTFYTLSNALINAGASALQFSQNMETAAISMEYFVEGVNKVAKSQAYLRSVNLFAARTPFSTEEALGLSRYMQAVGVFMRNTKSLLQVVTDTAAATGATRENLQRIVFGLGQMMTKGRIANEEIRQLANANIPIYEILQEQLGLTGSQIANIGDYWIDANKAVVAILQGLEKRYGGAADRISNTMTGMTDTIVDNSKIIAQVVSSGVYDSLAEKMTNLRDAMDRYREIATTRGSMGLFDQILRDIDATGELGNRVLALIGNARQLGRALSSLYVSAKPVIGLFGKSLYVSVNAAAITLTSLTRAADGLIKRLDSLGITSGRTAEVLASLFITYQAAKWVGFLGQAATSTAFSLYNAASSMTTILPAALQAHKGVAMLSLGLIGLTAYGLAFYGVLNKINNAMAGLSSKKGDLFPADYEQAMQKYNEEMRKYNEAIEAYTKDYEDSYRGIADGTSDAVDGFGDIADASKKAAKSVKNDWVAAFDEVYTIPDEKGLELDSGAIADLGALLSKPLFDFPALKDLGVELKMPEAPWADFFEGGFFDSDVLKTSWWKAFIPAALSAAAIQIGKVIAANTRKTPPTGGSPTSAFQGIREATEAFKGMSKQFTEYMKGLGKTADAIKSGQFKSATELEGLYRVLDEQLLETTRLLDKLNKQAAIAGKYDQRIEAAVLDEFKNLSELHKIRTTVQRISDTAQQMTDLGPFGDTARKQYADLLKQLQNQYSEFVARIGGSSPELNETVKGLLDTDGLAGRLQDLVEGVNKVRGAVLSDGTNLVSIKDEVTELAKLGKNVTEELKKIGITTGDIQQANKLLDEIVKLQSTQVRMVDLKQQIDGLKDQIATFDARRAAGQFIGVSKGSLEERLVALQKQLQKLETTEQIRLAALYDTIKADAEAMKVQQELIVAAKTFGQITGQLDTNLTAIIRPLKALERYSGDLMLSQLEGQKVIKQALLDLSHIIAGFKGNEVLGLLSGPLVSTLTEIKAALSQMLDTRELPAGIVQDMTGRLVSAVQEIGNTLGVDPAKLGGILDNLTSSIETEKGIYSQLDYIRKEIEKADKAEPKSDVAAARLEVENKLLDAIDDNVAALMEGTYTLEQFDAQLAKLRKGALELFGDTAVKLDEQIMEILGDAHDQYAQRLEALKGVEKLAKAGFYPIAGKSDNMKLLLSMLTELKSIAEWKIGDGIRSGRALAEDFASEIIKQAGLFDPARVALSGGDVAGLFGQSGYGINVFSALANNLLKSVRMLESIPDQLFTLQSIANMAAGTVAETAIMPQLASLLEELGYSLAIGGNFFDATRKMQAQIDTLLLNAKGFVAPLDIKALSSFDKTMKPILETIATKVDGIHKISADGFKQFIKALDDVAWQLALQATIMGTDTAWLGVLDTRAAGIAGPDLGAVAKYNPAIAKDVDAIRSIVESQMADQYALRLDKIRKHLHLIEVQIPGWAKDSVRELASMFEALQELVSLAKEQGMDIKELLTPMNTLGQKIGSLTHIRYDGDAYKAPATGNAALTSVLRDIENQLKSTHESVREMGALRLADIIERLKSATYDGTGSLVERAILNLGTTVTGEIAHLNATGEELLQLVPKLEAFKAAFETRSYSLTVQLDDLVKQLNRAADANMRIEDVLRYNADGTAFTVKDLLYQIIATDKSLHGGSGSVVAKQAYSALDAGAAMDIMNPAAFANVSQVIQILGKALEGTAGASQAANILSRLGDISSIPQILGKALEGTAGASQAANILSGLGDISSIPNFGPDDGKIGNSVRAVFASMDDFAEFMPKTAARAAKLAETIKNTWTHVDGTTTTKFTVLEGILDKIDDAAMYQFKGDAAVSGAQLRRMITRHTPIEGRTILDSAGQVVYEPAMAQGLSSFTGKYSPGKTIFGARFGKYIDDTTGSSGLYARLGDIPGVKEVRVDGAKLGQALSILSIIVGTASMVKSSRSANKIFRESILPGLPEDEQAAAQERAKSLGMIGFDSGMFSGNAARAFLDIYAEMTEQERLFWGTLLSSGKSAKDFFSGTGSAMLGQGSNVDVLKDVLNMRPLVSVADYGIDELRIMMGKGSTEEKLQALLDLGVGESKFASVVDYIVTSGDTQSRLATEFYSKYGKYMDTIIRPAYGMDSSWDAAANALLSAGILKEQLAAAGVTMSDSDSVPISMKPIIDAILLQLQDATEARILPILEAQEKYQTDTASPLQGVYTRILEGTDFSSISSRAAEELSSVLGISFENIADGIGKMSIDSEKIMDNIVGWTMRLPETISLDGANISTQDAQILAQAGIQINADGTVTFMNALNENMTGTDRKTELTISDVSKAVMDKLASSGLSFDFSGPEARLNLSLESVSKNMRSAMFMLNTNLVGQVSDSMRKALSGLGTVLDSGYFEITNKAVLNGNMSITEYIRSMGKKADELSPEVRRALESIDDVIRQGGEATRQTVAEWAAGVVIKSPISREDLTAEIEAAFAAMGISFQQQGEEFLMVINRVGNQLSNGMTLIPADTWNRLSEDIKTALSELGVVTTEAAGLMLVDLSGVMEKGVGNVIEIFANRPDLWDQIPGEVVKQLAAAGVAVTNGMITINTEMLNGLVRVDTQWFATWNSLPDDVKAAMGTAGLETEDGLMRIELLTETTKIPANVDEYIIKPFSELPAEIQDRLTGGDNSVRAALMDSEVIITGATKDAFVGAVQAVHDNFEAMNREADSGATQLANTIAQAMAQVQRLNDISIRKSWNPFDDNSQVKISGKAGSYTIVYGGQVYKGIRAGSEAEAVKMVEMRTGLDIPGYAYGGIITTDGLYRAGEFGKQEGIIPLENRTSLGIIGDAIASQMSPTGNVSGVSYIGGFYTDAIRQLVSAMSPAATQNSLAINGAVDAISTLLTMGDTELKTVLTGINEATVKTLTETREALVSKLAATGTLISDGMNAMSNSLGNLLSAAISAINSAAGSLNNAIYSPSSSVMGAINSARMSQTPLSSAYTPYSSYDYSGSSSLSSMDTKKIEEVAKKASADVPALVTAQEDLAKEVADAIRKAQADYAKATTQAAKDAAHAAAEAARARLGYSGGADGSKFIPIGSTHGSLVTKDALYRAGEFGLQEAIIPLERPSVMQKIGQAIANSMPVDPSGRLAMAMGVPNAGVVVSSPRQTTQQVQDTDSMVSAITKSVLEYVLPAMARIEPDPVTPVYVHTMIADRQGLKELERKLYDIRLEEDKRRR